ncbi:MAG TPA: hypothetical protein VMU26_06660 [Candidatus Polarisedimenticolia bacterium]|nr:hypothetical protein [Candidatus Polarisedimenticolia bacterium]
MTREQQIRAVEGFGYTEAEARFLCLVALHGGYFVRRQFLHSAGCELGKRAQDFVDKTTARKHACREVYREDRHLFRLHYKPIYAAIGEEDNRNRREHQPATIRLRLMGLDFVLEHPEHQFLAAQQDKLRYFLENRKIEADLLPSRGFCARGAFVVRHFVDGFPMFLTAGHPPAMSFTYVDDGQLTTAAFRSFLAQYSRLFQALGSVGLSFLTRSRDRFEAAQKALDRFCDRVAGGTRQSIDIDRLLAHFPHRLMAEHRDTRQLNKNQMDRLGLDLDTFEGPEFRRLFELWKNAGDDAVRAEFTVERDLQKPLSINFTACILEHDYDLFGTLQAAS